MGKAINIRLVPIKGNKIYKPKPDYADLFQLTARLHITSINEALEDIKPVSDLELKHLKAENQINYLYQEESALTLLSDSLEKLIKEMKKSKLSQKSLSIESECIQEYSSFVRELDSSTTKGLKLPDTEHLCLDPDSGINDLEADLSSISDHKQQINQNIHHLKELICLLNTEKENIQASQADVDSLEVAIKNMEISSKLH